MTLSGNFTDSHTKSPTAKEAQYHSHRDSSQKGDLRQSVKTAAGARLGLDRPTQANTLAVAARLESSDKLHAMCKNGYRGFLDTFSTHISLHLKPADNMDGASSLNAVEVADVLTF